MRVSVFSHRERAVGRFSTEKLGFHGGKLWLIFWMNSPLLCQVDIDVVVIENLRVYSWKSLLVIFDVIYS